MEGVLVTRQTPDSHMTCHSHDLSYEVIIIVPHLANGLPNGNQFPTLLSHK